MGMIRKHRVLDRVVSIPIEQICASPNQPRKAFDPEKLDQLSQSIHANGLLQPVTVIERPDGGYQLVAGERRLLACRQLGYLHIPAIIREYDAHQRDILSLIENLQRESLNFFEEAAAIEALLKSTGESQQQLAKRLGKAQSTIANKLRLLRYPPPIQQLMLRHGLTERHARALLPLQDEPRLTDAVQAVAQRELTVAQTEKLVEELLTCRPRPRVYKRGFVVKDLRIFMNTINRAVDIMKQSGIQALSEKQEDEEYICVTIRIPKTPSQGNRTSA